MHVFIVLDYLLYASCFLTIVQQTLICSNDFGRSPRWLVIPMLWMLFFGHLTDLLGLSKAKDFYRVPVCFASALTSIGSVACCQLRNGELLAILSCWVIFIQLEPMASAFRLRDFDMGIDR